MKINKKQIILIASMSVLMVTHCSVNNTENDPEPLLAFLLEQQNRTASAVTLCDSSNAQAGVVDFRGRVLDGGLDDSQGSPIALAEIQTQPVIWNVNVTDTEGRFTTPTDLGVCIGTEYTFTAKKYGYEERRISAVAQRGEVDVTFLMRRDTASFSYPTVRVLSGSTLIAGANISFSAGGANRTFQTGSSGQTSVAFPKNSTIAIAVQKSGYGDVSFNYNVTSGFVDGANGGTVTGSDGIITVSMVAK